jgi:CheY-specific phosphatase CheX
MEQQIRNIMAVVANETLEKLAFLFAFSDDERVNDGPEPAVTGRVDFNGYFSGVLMMRISQGAVAELAVNMLGLDDDSKISDDEQQDAFKEMLNVICGNLLPAIAGDQREFSIGPPLILSEDETRVEFGKKDPLCVARLMLEDGFCDLYFFPDGRLPEEISLKESAEI